MTTLRQHGTAHITPWPPTQSHSPCRPARDSALSLQLLPLNSLYESSLPPSNGAQPFLPLQVNRFLLDLIRVGEVHGIKFPREFALLIKQLLYFGEHWPGRVVVLVLEHWAVWVLVLGLEHWAVPVVAHEQYCCYVLLRHQAAGTTALRACMQHSRCLLASQLQGLPSD